MRKIKISLLALSTCVLGTTAHTAVVGGVETFTAYNLGINYTNSSAQYWSINGGPNTTGTSFLQIFPSLTSVMTDGSGHISGSGELVVTYNTAGVPFSIFYVDYSGRVSASTTVPTAVTLFIKGKGYTVDGTGRPTATNNSVNLKFTGAPGVNPLNKNQTRIVGDLTGRITGSTPLGVNQAIPAIQAVFNGGASRSSFVNLSPDILQSTKRMQLFDPFLSGLGTITDTTYKFRANGTGTARGATFAVNGFLGPYTNNVGTNLVGFTAPISADLKGKLMGQVVSGSATPTQIDPSLIQ
jgi:hypothetical protein